MTDKLSLSDILFIVFYPLLIALYILLVILYELYMRLREWL